MTLIHTFAAVAILFFIFLGCLHIKPKKKQEIIEEPLIMPTADQVRKDYEFLLDGIQGAPTHAALYSFDDLINEFEERNRPHAWVGDMAGDLRIQVREREVKLDIRRAMKGVKI